MHPLTPQDVVSAVKEIGALPQTLATVLKVVDNPDSRADDIAAVINCDVSLTSRVLKMVNSVRYGRSRKVAHVSEAVRVMGLNSIKVLTLSSSVFGIRPDDELFQQLNIKRIWRHFIETAIVARNIAEDIDYRDPEEAFVTGLLHDIGIVIMMLHFKKDYLGVIETLKAKRTGVISAELELWPFTHCDVGAAIAESWKLPSRVIHVIRHHHDISSPAIIPDDDLLNAIIAAADRIALGPFDHYTSGVEDDIMFVQTAREKIGLNHETLKNVRKKSLIQSIELADYLELDAGDVIEVLADANDRLAELYFSLEQILIDKNALENRPAMVGRSA
ncbi:MAG: HDOD domain-containing protein [candidate division Zixibacteria bacterium]|nr:HDOD domain-containing protein [candidate division Zixibacteria bacterium]